jgi:hypothetical protein
MSYFVSLDQFEHLLALVLIAIHTWQHHLEHLFNLIAILLKLLYMCISCIHSMFWGGVALLWANLDKCMCQQGGESYTQKERHAFIWERLHLLRGSCIWVALKLLLLDVLSPFASSWGLAVFYLVVSSLCPCLWGPSFCQVLLTSNDPVLAFSGFWSFRWVLPSSFSISSFAQVVRVRMLTMHSSRGRLRTQGREVPLWYVLWWVIVNVIHE